MTNTLYKAVLGAAVALAAAAMPAAAELGPVIGQVQPRDAADIASNNWSVGAETMDRSFTIYDNWKSFLGPLGVKKARIQSGWARTEPTPGTYDFAWLDNIIPDMAGRGVSPWVSLSYGNPAYTGGGTPNIGSPLPTSPQALAAWEAYVGAMVDRYGQHVTEWEIWNEPDLGSQSPNAQQYGQFVIRTAEVIRARQPEAVIITGALSGGGMLGYGPAFLQEVADAGKLHLVDEVSYHVYPENPDTAYPVIQDMHNLLRAIHPDVAIRSGESGAPSERQTRFALAGRDWTETTQAKWALRRMLGDLARDIPSSLFGIMEMDYTGEDNTKGLLALPGNIQQDRPDSQKVVAHVKQGYRAVQHLTAIFDDTLVRTDDFAITDNISQDLFAVAYERADGSAVVSLWLSGDTPDNDLTLVDVDLQLSGVDFIDPVWVDLLSGEIRPISPGSWSSLGGMLIFDDLPLYDSPVLIAERSVVIPEPGVLAASGVLLLLARCRR